MLERFVEVSCRWPAEIIGVLPTGLPVRAGGPVAILALLFFPGLGVDMIIHPRRHMPAHLRGGGEMRRDLKELSIQFVGLLTSCFAGGVLFDIGPEVWHYWVR
jgi:hypothetical protein